MKRKITFAQTPEGKIHICEGGIQGLGTYLCGLLARNETIGQYKADKKVLHKNVDPTKICKRCLVILKTMPRSELSTSVKRFC